MNVLACNGIVRNADDERSVTVCFTRPLTDEEFRSFHDACRRAASELDALATLPESTAARFAREVREGTARFVTPDGKPTGGH